MNAMFLQRMENLLYLYGLPYDPDYPLVCFDERPCYLIGDILEELLMKPGKVSKQHYAYQKNGSCCLLAAIEPLSGKRLAEIHDHRTKKEYTLFMQELARQYPEAKKIRVVQDNLNTHNASSFYQHLPADEAFALAQKFEFHYTPKSGSWLNMIEIEFSALSRLCLDRRIPTKEKLETEIMAIIKERNNKQIKIHWQFTIEAARTKLSRHYQNVNEGNNNLNKLS